MNKWKTYPMGASSTERMELHGLTAYLSHAVREPWQERGAALCGIALFALCMDDSLATTDLPDCPKCRQRIAKL